MVLLYYLLRLSDLLLLDQLELEVLVLLLKHTRAQVGRHVVSSILTLT